MPEPSRPDRIRPRLTIVAALVVVMAAVGVSLIIGPELSSGAPIVARAGAPAPVPADSVPDAPPSSPGATAAGGTGPSTTTTVATPTTAPPPRVAPSTTTTAAARPRPVATPAPATTRPAASAAGTQLDQVRRIADSSGWDWRKVHVQFRIGFDPAACCHWGVYDPTDHKTIWIGPTAFDDQTRLRYVVLHELAHAWQWHSHRLNKLSADMAPWGYGGMDALEAGADCIATLWGADVHMGHYWTCPPDAQAVMARRLSGQWK
jgi:hypothetical protein